MLVGNQKTEVCDGRCGFCDGSPTGESIGNPGADLEGRFRGLQPPPKPWRPTVNSVQEFKFIIRYARRVQYKLSAKRKQVYIPSASVR